MTTDFIVGADEDSYLVARPDVPAESLDLAALRDEHFDALGIDRRDFLFYTYPADRSWARSVRDADAAIPNFEDALRAHQLIEAAYRSAASGEPIALKGDLSPP